MQCSSGSIFTAQNINCEKLLKQKVHLFSNKSSKRQKDYQNPEKIYSIVFQGQAKVKRKSSFALKPTLPSKKLFQDPRFFLSLQRRKLRIINGLKNMSSMQSHAMTQNNLKGTKLKQKDYSLRKIRSSVQTDKTFFLQTSRTAWQPKIRTPFLNYNMQYLIKKRKTMTPTPSSRQEQITDFIVYAH